MDFFEKSGGELLRGYEYGAANRLTRAWNREGEALYQYNGLGQRVGRRVNGQEENYLLDLTRPYHNLLGFTKGGKEQYFYWDGNVAAVEDAAEKSEAGPRDILQELHYYLQDDLGSPLRVSGYGGGKEQGYLSYGYDEFGKDLYDDPAEEGIPNPYGKQGEMQPFGYTGYRMDDVSGTYFAQAREYQAQDGRFVAEDVVKGNGLVPRTLNQYGYCWGNPLNFADIDGKEPTDMSFIGNSPLDIYMLGSSPIESNNFISDMYIQTHELNPLYPENFVPNTHYIEAIDENATYYYYDESSKPIEVQVQFGAGVYAELSILGVEVSAGAKANQQISSSNFVFTKQGVEVGASFTAVAGMDIKYSRVICPMYDNRVEESGLYMEPNLLGIEEDRGDYIYTFSAGLFVGGGAQIDIKLNLSMIGRWFVNGWNSLFKQECDS